MLKKHKIYVLGKHLMRYIKKYYSFIVMMLITSAHCLHSAQQASDEHLSPLFVEGAIRDKKYSTFILFFNMCDHILATQGEDSLDSIFESNSVLKNNFDTIYGALFSRVVNNRDSLLLFNYILQRKPSVIQVLEKSNKDLLHTLIGSRGTSRENVHRLIMFKTLLYHGANKESEEKPTAIYFRTPLIHAVGYGDESIASFLLSQGADIDAVDAKRKNAIQHMQHAYYKLDWDYWDSIEHEQAHSALIDYYRSRLENRIFQQCVGKKNGLIKPIASLISEYTIASHPVKVKAPSLLREYISAPISSLKLVHQQRALLATVKPSLKKNDFEPLLKFINGPPHTMHTQDGAGDTVLFAAVQSGNLQGMQLVVDRLIKLTVGESEHFKKAITQINEHGKQAWQYASDSIDKKLIEQITPEKEDTNIAIK